MSTLSDKAGEGKDGIAPPLRAKKEIIESPTKPPRTNVNFDGIPDEMKSRKQWVLWKWEKSKPNKNGVRTWTKVLYRISKRKADATDPKTWAKFCQIRLIYESDPSFAGIGYVFAADDPYTGTDLDDAIDLSTGRLKPWAAKIVTDFDTWTDISPTRTGVKLIGRGEKPGDRCKTAFHDGEVEQYSQDRFFTITGEGWPGTPPTIRECPDAIASLYAEAFGKPEEPVTPSALLNGRQNRSSLTVRATGAKENLNDTELIPRACKNPKFAALWNGDAGGYGDDSSRADLALCCHLIWWTDDAARADRLFRASGLMREKWDEKRGKETYGQRTLRRASARVAKRREAKQSDKSFVLGPLILWPGPGQPRQTASGKISMPVNVSRGGKILYPFVLTSAASGRKEPARMLRQLLGDDPAAVQVDRVLAELLAHAAEGLSKKQKATGPTIREIVASKVPEALQLVCRSERSSLWSESLGEEMRRCDLIAFTPPWLIDECAGAPDAPRDAGGMAVRPDLVRLIQVELGVVWADLLSTLPPAKDVDLGRDTARGREFRKAAIHLWKIPVTWEKQQTAGGDTATRASLASRVISQKIKVTGAKGMREKWHQIHPACDAWWRSWLDPIGEMQTLLAMRWTLPGQVGVDLPGVIDEESLTRLGTQFGVVQKPPEGVPSRLSGGTNRVAVLSLDLAGELLEEPSEDPEENPREPGA